MFRTRAAAALTAEGASSKPTRCCDAYSDLITRNGWKVRLASAAYCAGRTCV